MLTSLKSKWLPAWAEYSDCKTYSPLDAEDETLLTTFRPSERRAQWRWTVLLCTTNLLSIGVASIYAQQHFIQDYSMDLKGTSLTYSGVDRSLALRSFSRFDVERDSTYTETPSPKVDGAWHRLGLKSSTFILPADLGAQYGLDPQRFQYVKKGVWHKEREGYPVVLQALHDLHCVNMLRKSLYYNYPYYTNYIDHDKEPEHIRTAHINHCVDALRERVMCTADMGIIPFGWSRPNEGAKPYFQTQHKCHNFDGVLKWALENAEDVNTTQIEVPLPLDAVFDVA